MNKKNDNTIYVSADNALRALENRINFLETEIKSFDNFHPRAMKLMRKRKNFLVVAEDEPYFLDVYREIRKHEQKSGRWTEDDEIYYLKAKKANNRSYFRKIGT